MFVNYLFLNFSWLHLLFNLLVQVLVGLPLEMVHGSLRIGAVYMAGVLAGSLGTSVFDRDVYLVGASGGVYALLAAHLANVLLNYNNMEFGIVRLIGIFVVGKPTSKPPQNQNNQTKNFQRAPTWVSRSTTATPQSPWDHRPFPT